LGEEIIDNFDTDYKREYTYTEKYDARLEKFGREDVIPLWVADMDFATAPAIVTALQTRIAHPIFGYHYYHDNYLKAIQYWMHHQHQWELSLSEISPINTIVSALNIAVECFSNQGDGILIQTPIYPPFMHAITHQKRQILDNTLKIVAGRYMIDFDDFEKKAKEAKLFLFCSPHNPTGRVWSIDELEKIAAICKKNDLIIISDEVHADLCFQGHKHTPIGTLPSAKDITITLNAPSKTFNIASIVNAYAIVHNTKLKRKFISHFMRYSLLQPNPLSIVATIAAYRESHHWLDALKSYLVVNLRFINDKLDKMPLIKPLTPEATYLLWLDCRELGMDDKRLQEWFNHEVRVGLNPGSSFGKSAKGFMRLNFAHPRSQLNSALAKLAHAYKKL
jgi:cystathionine beta-lyase